MADILLFFLKQQQQQTVLPSIGRNQLQSVIEYSFEGLVEKNLNPSMSFD